MPTSQLSYIFFVDEKKATFLWLLSDACKKSKEEVRIYIFFYLYIRIQLLRIIKYATVGFHSSWTFVNFHDMLLNRILRRPSDFNDKRGLGVWIFYISDRQLKICRLWSNTLKVALSLNNVTDA